MITPGQTMDVLFTTDRTPSHYYMVASAFHDALDTFANFSTNAIIQYQGSYKAPSSPIVKPLPAFNDIKAADRFTGRLRSLANKKFPVNVPKVNITRIFMAVSLNIVKCANKSCNNHIGHTTAASLNNISFALPQVDILQAYYRNISGVFGRDFPTVQKKANLSLNTAEGTKVLMINYGEAVEIVYQGTNLGAATSHPMHLHGFSFYLVGMGYGTFNNVTDPLKYNLVDPPELNTINLPRIGWAAIRFVANNPGVWFLHCHFERHTTEGMATVLIVKDGGTSDTSMLPSPAYMPPCS